MKTLIQNARVVTGKQVERLDVLIDGSKIAAMDDKINSEADETIDADGLTLIPGVIDDQVHFREPGLTHKEDLAHASRACAKGGVTTFLEMPNTIPNAINQELLNDKLDLGAKHSIVNYGFYIGATPDNIKDLKSATRTPGIKIFIGSSTGDLLVDSQEALERIFAETTLPLTAHCEDETIVRENAAKYADSTDVADHSKIRDQRAAEVCVARAIDLAERHNHRFHVLHVSTRSETELIAAHLKTANTKLITGEACPHHLFFSINDYPALGSLIKMNPSIKTVGDNVALWNALQSGTLQVVATDHAPHTMEEKRLPFPQCPSGLPAVENSLSLMLNEVYKGECTLEQVVHWMCEAPAITWDIVNKGRIAVGYDADLVLVDRNRAITIRNEEQQTKSKWSPWDGDTLTGCAVKTWVMGRQVFELSQTGQIKFDESRPGSEAIFDHERGGYWGSCD